MLKLQQAAIWGPDKFEWSFGHLLSGGFWKDASQCLNAKAKNRYQITTTTYAALLNCFIRDTHFYWIPVSQLTAVSPFYLEIPPECVPSV